MFLLSKKGDKINNTEEVDTVQEELQQLIPTINGFELAKYERKGSEHILVPTPQTLLAFAYAINLLKKKELNTPNFFNHIDQELRVTENEDFDFTGIERIIQWLPFIPKSIQEKINDPGERAQIIREISNLRRELVSDIDEDALFFA